MFLFIVFNSIAIFQNSNFKDDLKALNKIVDKFGYKIDDEMEAKFENYYDTQLGKLNEITNKKTSKKNMKVYQNFMKNKTIILKILIIKKK